MNFTAQDVKKLRDSTGAGMLSAQQALVEADGNLDLAVDILRKAGAKIAAKKQDREAKEGIITSYIHAGGKVGVLVEVNCETDFVARHEAFQQLARDVALHVAAANPLYVAKEDVPVEVVAKEKEIYLAQLAEEQKPAEVKDKIVAGKLDKFYSEVCLLNQLFVKDETKTIGQYVTEVITKTGENIKIKRFIRYSLR